MTDLAPVTRPNGKPYRPRKIVAEFCDDGYGASVIVFGTHDERLARPLAVREATYRLSTDALAVVGPGWWRDGIENGERVWVCDDVRGRAGVEFEITE